MRVWPRVNKHRLLAALALLGLCCLLISCGGDGKGATLTPAPHSPSVVPSPTLPPPGSFAASLLTAADLSAEWQAGGPETFGPSTTFCGFSLPADQEPIESVSSTFKNQRSGFALAQYISRYAVGEAAAVLAEYRAAIEPCEEWVVPAAVGEETRYAVSVVEIDGVAGDETFGFAVTLPVDLGDSANTDPSSELEIQVVLTRVGDLVNWIVYGGLPLGVLPAEETEVFVRRAIDKLVESEGS